MSLIKDSCNNLAKSYSKIMSMQLSMKCFILESDFTFGL